MGWFENIQKQKVEIGKATDGTLMTTMPEDMFNVIHMQVPSTYAISTQTPMITISDSSPISLSLCPSLLLSILPSLPPYSILPSLPPSLFYLTFLPSLYPSLPNLYLYVLPSLSLSLSLRVYFFVPLLCRYLLQEKSSPWNT
jgi:hypothetical protein